MATSGVLSRGLSAWSLQSGSNGHGSHASYSFLFNSKHNSSPFIVVKPQKRRPNSCHAAVVSKTLSSARCMPQAATLRQLTPVRPLGRALPSQHSLHGRRSNWALARSRPRQICSAIGGGASEAAALLGDWWAASSDVILPALAILLAYVAGTASAGLTGRAGIRHDGGGSRREGEEQGGGEGARGQEGKMFLQDAEKGDVLGDEGMEARGWGQQNFSDFDREIERDAGGIGKGSLLSTASSAQRAAGIRGRSSSAGEAAAGSVREKPWKHPGAGFVQGGGRQEEVAHPCGNFEPEGAPRFGFGFERTGQDGEKSVLSRLAASAAAGGSGRRQGAEGRNRDPSVEPQATEGFTEGLGFMAAVRGTMSDVSREEEGAAVERRDRQSGERRGGRREAGFEVSNRPCLLLAGLTPSSRKLLLSIVASSLEQEVRSISESSSSSLPSEWSLLSAASISNSTAAAATAWLDASLPAGGQTGSDFANQNTKSEGADSRNRSGRGLDPSSSEGAGGRGTAMGMNSSAARGREQQGLAPRIGQEEMAVEGRGEEEEGRRESIVVLRSNSLKAVFSGSFAKPGVVFDGMEAGRIRMYEELLWFMRFGGPSRRNAVLSAASMRANSRIIAHDLIVSVSEAIVATLLASPLPAELADDVATGMLQPQLQSTRSFERFRNEVALRKWLRQNFTSVAAMFEDRFELWAFSSSVRPGQLNGQMKKTRQEKRGLRIGSWLSFLARRATLVGDEGLRSTDGQEKRLISDSDSVIGRGSERCNDGGNEHAGDDPHRMEAFGLEGSFSDEDFVQQSIRGRRRGELQRLRGWKLAFCLFLELSDVLGPLFAALMDKAGKAISFLLVALIGRSLGLIYRGIRQSWRVST